MKSNHHHDNVKLNSLLTLKNHHRRFDCQFLSRIQFDHHIKLQAILCVINQVVAILQNEKNKNKNFFHFSHHFENRFVLGFSSKIIKCFFVTTLNQMAKTSIHFFVCFSFFRLQINIIII